MTAVIDAVSGFWAFGAGSDAKTIRSFRARLDKGRSH